MVLVNISLVLTLTSISDLFFLWPPFQSELQPAIPSSEWVRPLALPQASVPPPTGTKGGRQHSPPGEGVVGRPNSGDWRESLLCECSTLMPLLQRGRPSETASTFNPQENYLPSFHYPVIHIQLQVSFMKGTDSTYIMNSSLPCQVLFVIVSHPGQTIFLHFIVGFN